MGVTIRDVAKHAGVSVATVSRYLNNSPLIASESVEKVRQSIQALNYEPNFMARNLSSLQSHTVALLVDNDNPETFGDKNFLQIQYGAEHALAEHGYYLMILSLTGANREKALKKLIREHRVDGVLLPAQLAKKSICNFLADNGIPHVVIGRCICETASWLDLDNMMAGRIATEKLLDTGARTVRFVGNGMEKVFVKERFEGFRQAMEAAGFMANEASAIQCPGGAAEGAALVAAELYYPDAYLVSDNETAFGILRALHERGISVPERVQLISFDNGLATRLSDPPMTVVDIDVYQLGIQASGMLYAQLETPTPINQQCLMPVELITRGTTR
ncbi:MAG: LacI family DNA-binding transcriptional regulator [Eubacteriales bacterium]|nr:LacI family DNA-binding transcriptional regulator [Eubacteriales bacterium]